MADKWNPRVWLRSLILWVNKPTPAEIAAHEAWQAEMYALLDWTRAGGEPPCEDSASPGHLQSPAGNSAPTGGRLH